MTEAATHEGLAQEHVAEAPSLSQPTLTERIRERPLLALGLAGLVGFVMGGGARSRTGTAILMLLGRVWLRRTATDAITGVITGYGSPKPNGAD
jgi:hypothetical protein